MVSRVQWLRFSGSCLDSTFEKPIAKEFRIWKTIKLGGIGNVFACRKVMKFFKCRIGSWGDDILGRISFKSEFEEEEVDLANVSVGELGFSSGSEYKHICARAVALGLELCPAEVGPQLRLQYKDQPINDWVRIAMKAIFDSGGRFDIFAVGHDYGELWLDGFGGHPERIYTAEYRFVFVIPRNKQ